MAALSLSRNNRLSAASGEDPGTAAAASPLLPIRSSPSPPPHASASPTRLSLNHHPDSDGGSGDAFNLTDVLAMMSGLDSRDGSTHSYEMVSPDDAGIVYADGSRRMEDGEGVVLVGGRSTADSQMHLDSQLDGGTDRRWEHVSAEDPTADNTRDKRQGGHDSAGGGRGQRPQLHLHTPYNPPPFHDRDYGHSYSQEDVHPALRCVNSAPPSDQPQEHRFDQHRPVTAYSAAGDFFKDFDGVHYSPDTTLNPPLPPATAPPTDRHHYNSHPHQPRPTSNAPNTSHFETPRDPTLVFYPAPVPAILNLPPLMAKDTQARNRLKKLQKRVSQQVVLDSTPTDGTGSNRRSVGFPEGGWTDAGAAASPSAGTDLPTSVSHSRRKSVANLDERPLSNLPPALRASAFFESMQPSPLSVAPELRESSAVATLDSILDASASAPPAAFTDHPMTGTTPMSHLQRNDYRHSVAMTVTLHPGESPRTSMDEADAAAGLRHSHSFESPTNNTGDSSALPTTLLAELESRKQQQKSRTRTAASAFPAGIRSTLLQLDAVAQVQAQTRRQRRTHLAWENPDEATGDEQDEDVPLGLLYQDFAARGNQRGGKDEDIPLGLLMQKEMEDAEPLSRRRERLRGHNQVPPQIPDPEEEEETLAQRMKRLRGSTSTFGDGNLDLSFDTPAPPPPAPIEEETLAQRRKRLQVEAEMRRRSEEAKVVQAEVRKRASMATLLQAQYGRRPLTGGGVMNPGGGLVHSAGGASMLRPQTSLGNMQGGMAGMGGGMHMGRIHMQGMGMQGVATMGGMRGMGGMGGTGNMGGMGGMGAPMTPQEMAMNNKQREMVERWRASVM